MSYSVKPPRGYRSQDGITINSQAGAHERAVPIVWPQALKLSPWTRGRNKTTRKSPVNSPDSPTPLLSFLFFALIELNRDVSRAIEKLYGATLSVSVSQATGAASIYLAIFAPASNCRPSFVYFSPIGCCAFDARERHGKFATAYDFRLSSWNTRIISWFSNYIWEKLFGKYRARKCT